MEATTRTFTAEEWTEHEQFVQMLRTAKQRKREKQEEGRQREAELQIELQRAKDDPFYQRATEGMVCEPTSIAEPEFKRGSFAAAIRRHRDFQCQWQANINQKLDEREKSRREAMKKFQLEQEEV